MAVLMDAMAVLMGDGSWNPLEELGVPVPVLSGVPEVVMNHNSKSSGKVFSLSLKLELGAA